MKALLEYIKNDMNISNEMKDIFTRINIKLLFEKILKEHNYFTINNLTGDFLHYIVGIRIYAGSKNSHQGLRSILSKSFRPLITKALRSGRIIKDGRQRFKVVK